MNVLDAAELDPAPDGGPPASIPVELLDRVDGAVLGPFTLLEQHLELRCQDPDLASFLAAFLAAFPPAPAARTRLDLVEVGGSWVAYQDGSRTVSAGTITGLARALVFHLNRIALQAPSDDVLLHTAVASREGRAVILPGRSGAGKSTLVAALVLGGWTYLSDEVAAVGPEGGLVRPYPRPLALERGSWDLLPELAGRWPADVPALVSDLWLVLPSSLGDGVVAAPAVPAAVVFPEVVPGAATHLEPLGRAETLERLLGHCLDDGRTGRDGFDRLVGLVRRCTCHRLILDGVKEAEAQLAPLVLNEQNGPDESASYHAQ